MREERSVRLGRVEPLALPVRRPADVWVSPKVGRWAWAALATIALAATVAPFWSSRLFPFQDGPEHLAAIRVIADYGNPAFGFSQWFVLDFHRLQYLGFYLPAALLAKAFGPVTACRLMLSLIALALAGATWLLLAAFGRDRRLALLAPLLFHTMPTYLGFFNYVESVPAAIALIALVEYELRQPRVWRSLVLAVGAPLLLWLHPSALAFLLGAAVLLALSSGEAWRRRGRVLLPLVPAAGLWIAWAIAAVRSDHGEVRATYAHPSWTGLPDKVLNLARFTDVLRGHADELTFGLIIAIWLALAFFARDRRPGTRAWRLPMIALLALAGYLVLPFQMGHMGYIALRALPFLAVFALVSPRIAPGKLASALLALAVLVEIGYSAKLAKAYRAFDQEAQATQLTRVLSAAQPGERLVGLIWDRHSRIFGFKPYLHFAQYYELWRGGRARVNFAETPWTPLRYRPGTDPVALPTGWEDSPWLFNPAREGAEADYVLVRGASHGPPPGPFVLKARDGDWALWQHR